MRTHGTKVILAQGVTAPITEGGIVLPENAKSKLPTGLVITIGGEVKVVKVADRVQFNPYAGSAIIVSGRDYLVVEEADILVILEDTDA
jgi:chaperonin GroES